MNEVRLDCAQHRVSVAGTDSTLSVSVVSHGSVDDPMSWLAACEALGDLPDFDRCVSRGGRLTIRATEVGMVSLDEVGHCAYPLLWASDARSQDDATWCRKKFNDEWWTEEVGLVPEAHHLVTKMSWLHRSEMETWNQIRHICSLEDFISDRLVADGESRQIMTRPDLVAEFGVWSPHTATYSEPILTLIDGQRDWMGVMPTVCPAGTELGSWHNRTVCR